MAKHHNKILFLITLVLLIVGTVSAVTTEETTINVEGFDLISWFRHTFGIQEFSIVGDYRQCNRYPFKTLEFNKGAFMSESANSYCSSDHGLLDVFDKNWNTIGEWKDDIGLYCGDNDGCIVEVYCCPHKECFRDWECEDWYGSGSDCKTKVADDVNIDYKSGSTFNYCTEPSGVQVTCWYKANGDCASRTYIGDTVCPATYMGKTLYDSRSECEGQGNGNGNGDGDNGDGCTSHSYYECYDDNVYWYDSCGVREGKKEECGYGCTGSGQCRTSANGNGNGDGNGNGNGNGINGDGIPTFSLNQVLFKIGDFEVTILILLIGIGAIFVIKTMFLKGGKK